MILNKKFLIISICFLSLCSGMGLYYIITTYYIPHRKLSRAFFDESLTLGKSFLLNNQKTEGNFTYEYDFAQKKFSKGDNQVRQAGALWGLTLVHQALPDNESRKAVAKGLDFFDKNSKIVDKNKKFVVYPGEKLGKTGTNALLILSLIDYLRSEKNHPESSKYKDDLEKYINHLLSLQMENGMFHKYYKYSNGIGIRDGSPYSDGEALLALIKAAKYSGYSNLKNRILSTANKLYKIYVTEALKKDPDSKITKGFYQWSSMAFYEIYTTGWKEAKPFAQRTIDLAYWMIDVHETLRRRKNTAYAHEGMLVAWELAKLNNNQAAMEKIGSVINQGLYKLTSWQVGGPNENLYLFFNPTCDIKAVGGVMNSWSNPVLRIDVTQHQMHAVILARKFIYH